MFIDSDLCAVCVCMHVSCDRRVLIACSVENKTILLPFFVFFVLQTWTDLNNDSKKNAQKRNIWLGMKKRAAI